MLRYCRWYCYTLIGFLHVTPPLHLQYFQQRMSVTRHGHPLLRPHLPQVQGSGRTSTLEQQISGSIILSFFYMTKRVHIRNACCISKWCLHPKLELVKAPFNMFFNVSRSTRCFFEIYLEGIIIKRMRTQFIECQEIS